MRTTLNVDDDVLLAVKERARREHRSAGEVMSDLARTALTGTHESPSRSQSSGFHGFKPLGHRGRPVTNSLIDELMDEMTQEDDR
ncbi:MAG: hypothetical protein U0904_09965 [Candidatus Nanopelagicales bacterium]|nr:hypothetical protein [Candidatus Nanopelagicales bacterium]